MRTNKQLLILSATLAAAVPRATLAQSAEYTSVAYPRAADHIYQLPKYSLAGTTGASLVQCDDGTPPPPNIRFKPDGTAFQLDPVPAGIDWSAGVVRSIKIRRGQRPCFDLEIRIVEQQLEKPDPTKWKLAWSSDRPTKLDILVPSAELAHSGSMRDDQRLFFPELQAGIQPSGEWIDCAIACRWRIDIRDKELARSLLGAATVRIAVNSRALANLPPDSAIFLPSGEPMPARVPGILNAWEISPSIVRNIAIPVGTTRVPLEFFAAYAFKTGTTSNGDAEIISTDDGLVLTLKATLVAAARAQDIDVDMINGQKAKLKIQVYDAKEHVLRYVGRAEVKKAKLPPGLWFCDASDASSKEVALPASPNIRVVSSLQQPSTNACNASQEKAQLNVENPILREADIEALALDWSPETPRRLELYVKSKVLKQDIAIRDDTSFRSGTHGEGQWLPCAADYCLYRIEEIDTAGGLIVPSFEIVSARMSSEAAPLLDVDTGLPLEPQLKKEIRLWKTAEDHLLARVIVPANNSGKKLRALVEPHLGRFLKIGQSVACQPNALNPCAIVQGQKDIELEIGGTVGGASAGFTIDGVAMINDVKLAHITQGSWAAAPLTTAKLRVSFTTCRYLFRQLTHAMGGMNEASVLFKAELRSGTETQCASTDWEVLFADTTNRGRGTLRDGFLDITFESLPVPPNATGKSYILKFNYPTGQSVESEQAPLVQVGAQLDLNNDKVLELPLRGGERVNLQAFAKLATRRENILSFNALNDPTQWQLEILGARSLYTPCRGSSGAFPAALTKIGEYLPYDATDRGYCIEPSREASNVLRLRATRWGTTAGLLLADANAANLPATELARERSAGWTTVDTAYSTAEYRMAIDLTSRTTMSCGFRTLTSEQGSSPKAVEYRDFEKCFLKIKLSSPHEESVDGWMLDKFLAFYGEQKMVIKGSLINGETQSTPEVLAALPIRKGLGNDGVLSIRLNLAEIGTTPAKDWDVVDIELSHETSFYVENERWSAPKSTVHFRIRRGPEYFGKWGDNGLGVRSFLTFTAAAVGLFRSPHSGKAALTSAQADNLESAGIGAGMLWVLEPWNFDDKEGIIPVANPQAQVGFLASSIPSASDLAIPSFSFVAGFGLRTGVGTSPTSAAESALKLVAWYEALWQEAGRGNHPSHHILFGFNVDVGTLFN